MTKVSLKDINSIICDRCGTWHKSESDHKKHLQTTCNADLEQSSKNGNEDILSSAGEDICSTQQSSLMTHDTNAKSSLSNIRSQAALPRYQQSTTTPLISNGN